MRLAAILAIALLTGCATPSYRDMTVDVPDRTFEETPLSKAVVVGSAAAARDANCTFIQRYKLRTNAGFDASMALFRHRAALMGAHRVAVVRHEEVDGRESRYVREETSTGTTKNTPVTVAMHTTIVADLYDCSCPGAQCVAK